MEIHWFVYITIGMVALVQIPIAVDMLRFVFPKWKLARFASRTVHFVLFFVMGCIFCIAISYHLFIYLPLLAGQDSLQSLKGMIHVIFALWVWVNVIGNYYYSVFLHPGVDKDYKPPSHTPKLCRYSDAGAIVEAKEGDLSRDTMRRDTATTTTTTKESLLAKGELFYCSASYIIEYIPKTGAEWEPTRTHYCKICECAVPYLDHHCPFTGNCAGLRNYSNFFLGLCYGVLGLFYAVLITLPYFFECNLKGILWYFGFTESRVSHPVCEELGPHSHIFMPVFAGFFLSGNMLLLQIFLLASDLSTYSVLKNWSKAPMLRFMVQRIRARKYNQKGSRLNVLIRNQRKGFLWYLIPVRNSPQL